MIPSSQQLRTIIPKRATKCQRLTILKMSQAMMEDSIILSVFVDWLSLAESGTNLNNNLMMRQASCIGLLVDVLALSVNILLKGSKGPSSEISKWRAVQQPLF